MRREMRLKHIARIAVSNVDKKSAEDERPVRLCNYTDVYYNERITRNLDFMSATASNSQLRDFRLCPGDVLITKDSETPDDIAVPALVEESTDDLVCGYHLALVRPDERLVDPRFLFWALASTSARSWFSTQATGVTRFGLRAQSIGDARLSLPSLLEQREIADFLDAETARIDALIEKKRHMIDLFEERNSVLLRRALEVRGFRWGASLERPAAGAGLPTGWMVAHLSTLLEQLTNGYVGPTRDLLVDDGVKYIQSLHIKDGAIDFSRRPYYVPCDWHDERPRIHLRPGDVLLVQTGDIGQVAVVPPDFGPASCHALQIARVRRDLLVGDYLAAYLRSPFGRQSLLSRVTGALHPHLEGGIRDIPIVVPPLRVQTDVVDEIRDRSGLIDRLRSDLARQIVLLREHRQAMITAGVTGQLDVAKAAA